MSGALGTLLLVNVHDTLVPREDVLAWFRDLDLDEEYVPAPRSAYDAFKAATSIGRRAAFTADAPWLGAGVKIELRWELGKDPHTRTLVRRKVRGKELLGSERIAEAVFVKKGTKPRYLLRPHRDKVPQQSLDGPLGQFFRQVEYAYRTALEYLDQDDMRAVVREYLLIRLRALRVGTRGNYFVHSDLTAELDRLGQLLTKLGPDSHLLRLSLADDPDNRAVLTQALRARLAEDIDRLTKRAAAARRSPNALRYADLYGDYQDLITLTTDYVDALGLPADTPELAKLDDLTDQIVHLGTQRRD